MLEGLERLVHLSRLDVRLAGLEEEHTGIPGRRARLEEERAACDARDADAAEASKAAEAAQRQAEADLQDREELLRRLEGQQHQVKTNDAYTALLHEMEGARQAISACETRILEGMEAVEAALAERHAADAEGRRERTRLAREDEVLGARQQELERQMAQLREEREAACQGLERGVLEHYQKVASRRRPAVVLVKDEICGSCRVRIPSQVWADMLKRERLVSCGSCYRILLFESHVAPAS